MATYARKARAFLLLFSVVWSLSIVVFFSGIGQNDGIHDEKGSCLQSLIADRQHGETGWIDMNAENFCNPTAVRFSAFSSHRLHSSLAMFRRWFGPLRIGYVVDFLGAVSPLSWSCSAAIDGSEIRSDFSHINARPPWHCHQYAIELMEWEQGTIIKGYIPVVESAVHFGYTYAAQALESPGKDATVIEIGRTRGEWIVRSAKMHQQLSPNGTFKGVIISDGESSPQFCADAHDNAKLNNVEISVYCTSLSILGDVLKKFEKIDLLVIHADSYGESGFADEILHLKTVGILASRVLNLMIFTSTASHNLFLKYFLAEGWRSAKNAIVSQGEPAGNNWTPFGDVYFQAGLILLERPVSEIHLRQSATSPSFMLATLGNNSADSLSAELATRGFLHPTYTPVTYHLLEEGCKRNDYFIDLGANHGYFSFLAAAMGCRAHMFEANPRLWKLLRASIKANGWEERVVLHPRAVSLNRGSVRLKIYNGHSGLSHFDSVKQNYNLKTISFEDVVASRVDDELKIVGQNIAMIKIDVEGVASAALLSAKNLIQNNRVAALFLEFDKEDPTLAGEALGFLVDGMSPGYSLQTLPIEDYHKDLQSNEFWRKIFPGAAVVNVSRAALGQLDSHGLIALLKNTET